MSIKIEFKPIETELGVIKGRDSIYLDEINYDYVNKKVELLGEIECSEKLNHAEKIRNQKLKSFLVQTYDDVFEVICESYNFKLY